MDNVSLVTEFTLWGLGEAESHRWLLFSVTLLSYCLILLVNGTLVLTVVVDKNLHQPMYVFLCNLCLNGLYGTAGFYPKFLLDLASVSHVISYGGCLLQAFVMYSFACSDLSILTLMSFDRYLAICRPLQYRALMTRRRVLQLVCFSWLTPLCLFSVNVLLTSRLPLCRSSIPRLFCVNWVVVQLACSPGDALPNSVMAFVTIVLYVAHALVILGSYVYLIKTCRRSVEVRGKFMQTCVPHLICLFTFLIGIVFDLMYMRFGSKDLPQSLQSFIAVEFLLIPPVMNPLLYGFKLRKIRRRILAFVDVRPVA